jgi:hypothetical protein
MSTPSATPTRNSTTTVQSDNRGATLLLQPKSKAAPKATMMSGGKGKGQDKGKGPGTKGTKGKGKGPGKGQGPPATKAAPKPRPAPGNTPMPSPKAGTARVDPVEAARRSDEAQRRRKEQQRSNKDSPSQKDTQPSQETIPEPDAEKPRTPCDAGTGKKVDPSTSENPCDAGTEVRGTAAPGSPRDVGSGAAKDGENGGQEEAVDELLGLSYDYQNMTEEDLAWILEDDDVDDEELRGMDPEIMHGESMETRDMLYLTLDDVEYLRERPHMRAKVVKYRRVQKMKERRWDSPADLREARKQAEHLLALEKAELAKNQKILERNDANMEREREDSRKRGKEWESESAMQVDRDYVAKKVRRSQEAVKDATDSVEKIKDQQREATKPTEDEEIKMRREARWRQKKFQEGLEKAAETPEQTEEEAQDPDETLEESVEDMMDMECEEEGQDQSYDEVMRRLRHLERAQESQGEFNADTVDRLKWLDSQAHETKVQQYAMTLEIKTMKKEQHRQAVKNQVIIKPRKGGRDPQWMVEEWKHQRENKDTVIPDIVALRYQMKRFELCTEEEYSRMSRNEKKFIDATNDDITAYCEKEVFGTAVKGVGLQNAKQMAKGNGKIPPVWKVTVTDTANGRIFKSFLLNEYAQATKKDLLIYREGEQSTTEDDEETWNRMMRGGVSAPSAQVQALRKAKDEEERQRMEREREEAQAEQDWDTVKSMREAVHNRPAKGKGKGKGGSSSSSDGMQCHNCKEWGHVIRDCPHETRCHACGKDGHRAKDCPEQQCFRCQEFGHKADQCTNEQRTRKQGPTSQEAKDKLKEKGKGSQEKPSKGYGKGHKGEAKGGYKGMGQGQDGGKGYKGEEQGGYQGEERHKKPWNTYQEQGKGNQQGSGRGYRGEPWWAQQEREKREQEEREEREKQTRERANQWRERTWGSWERNEGREEQAEGQSRHWESRWEGYYGNGGGNKRSWEGDDREDDHEWSRRKY